MPKPALLVLADGSEFHGQCVGAEGSAVGEVVFNTALTGYQEILTDPSYASQLVTLTYPHIGNTGINAEDEESRALFCAGLIIRQLPQQHSSWRAESSLSEYLTAKGLVALSGIDTRRLTRLLRTNGAQNGCIVAGYTHAATARAEAHAKAQAYGGLRGLDLAKQVSVAAPYEWNTRANGGSWQLVGGYQDLSPTESAATARPPSRPTYRVVAYDFGLKHTILRLLAERGCQINVVPATTTAEQVLAYQPHGVFLSNGPGDPAACDYAIRAIQRLLEANLPIFGICLGHQLLALASGARTEKMKFGHHGANHPVQELRTRKVLITSQNHGFTVDESSLPSTLRVTHRSLFDHSVQGIERLDKPAFSFQGHPEASPGPKDINGLFARFIHSMQHHRQT